MDDEHLDKSDAGSMQVGVKFDRSIQESFRINKFYKNAEILATVQDGVDDSDMMLMK